MNAVQNYQVPPRFEVISEEKPSQGKAAATANKPPKSILKKEGFDGDSAAQPGKKKAGKVNYAFDLEETDKKKKAVQKASISHNAEVYTVNS